MIYQPTDSELKELWFYARHYEYLMYWFDLRFTNFWCEYVFDNNPIQWDWFIWENMVYPQSKEELVRFLGILINTNEK